MPKFIALAVSSLLFFSCGAELPVAKGPARLRGLWTSPNELLAPDGSLEVADNVTIDRAGLLEPRRGYEAMPVSVSGAVNSQIWWRNYLFIHHGTSSLSRSDGSTVTLISGTYSPPDANTRVRFYVSAGSLFFLTSAGMYEIDSPTATPRLTGSPAALDSTATLRRTSNETGFATADGQWAYRVVIGYVNANRRLQLGRTSGRFIVQNPANVTALAANISKAGTALVTVINTTHGFATGEYVDVDLQGTDANFAEGRFQVTVLSATSFTYNDGGAAVVATSTVNIVYGFTSRNVDLSIRLPSGTTTSHFVQVYRSAKSASATGEPSDSLGQVYERSPTAPEVTAGLMTITDVAFDEIRGAEIYISTDARQELAQKDRPPLCNDVAEFRNSTWFVCTQNLQALEVQLLAVGGTTGLAVNDIIYFRSPLASQEVGFYGVFIQGANAENVAAGEFQVFTSGTPSQNVANTAKSIVRTLNGYASNTNLYASYQSGSAEAPGRIRIFGRTAAVTAFTVQLNLSGTQTREPFTPQVPRFVNITSLARLTNVVTVDTGIDHNVVVGQVVELERGAGAAEANFPVGTKTVATVVDANTFTYNENGADATALSTYAIATQPLTTFQSFNDDFSNGVMWSDPDQPWAVPLTQFQTVGPDTSTILRVIPTRDRLLLVTERSTYQVTGTFPNWAFDEFDLTSGVAAYNTLTPVAGRVAGLLNQGIGAMADSVAIISTPIEATVRDLMAEAASNVRARAFGVAYEEDRKFLLFLPLTSAATDCDNAYVYHFDSNDWTRFTISNVTAAAVNDADGRLYLGRSDGSIWKENKSRSGQADFYDTSTAVVVEVSPAPTSTTCTLDDATGVSPGDSIRFFSGAETLITAVNGNDLTFISTDDVVTGDATVYHHFVTQIQPLAFTAGEADSEKLFTNGVLLTDQAYYTGGLTLSFTSDLNPVASTPFDLTPPIPTTTPRALPFPVPGSWQRGGRLGMLIRTAHARQKMTLMSYTITSRVERGGVIGR